MGGTQTCLYLIVVIDNLLHSTNIMPFDFKLEMIQMHVYCVVVDCSSNSLLILIVVLKNLDFYGYTIIKEH